jgi:hypothetical protein
MVSKWLWSRGYLSLLRRYDAECGGVTPLDAWKGLMDALGIDWAARL